LKNLRITAPKRFTGKHQIPVECIGNLKGIISSKIDNDHKEAAIKSEQLLKKITPVLKKYQ